MDHLTILHNYTTVVGRRVITTFAEIPSHICVKFPSGDICAKIPSEGKADKFLGPKAASLIDLFCQMVGCWAVIEKNVVNTQLYVCLSVWEQKGRYDDGFSHILSFTIKYVSRWGRRFEATPIPREMPWMAPRSFQKGKNYIFIIKYIILSFHHSNFVCIYARKPEVFISHKGGGGSG